ncbi:hypothetical protein [Rhodococcus sp. IEGM 1318]|uniref:hypothetical protein n=1 Tax=Rhodococcus sp. IEGM 1318 TaxID=3082226 RepID=UPI002952E503|nr:hypothetical protein [Rhodococcus sp. IEGM 1318]MDV8006769.1 hypothetical protein [Rhodococcus sp. IEGM 1318]
MNIEKLICEKETREALAGTYTPAGIELWMTVANPRTYNFTPLEAIREGFGAKVLDLAKRLAAGRSQ